MKKNYTKKMINYIAVIGLLIFLHYTKLLIPVENVVISVLDPITSGIYSMSINLKSSFQEKAEKKDLIIKLEKIEAETKELLVENAELKKVEEENEKLRQFLRFTSSSEFGYLLSNVVSRGAFSDADINGNSLIIDKGSDDGVKNGLVVVDSFGMVVGKIIETKNNISKICLVTDTGCKFAAAFDNSAKTAGVTEGQLGLTTKINFIPQTENIQLDNLVTTSGLEANIPRGLVLGKVTEITKDNNEVFQQATIESLVGIEDLVIVSILFPKDGASGT